MRTPCDESDEVRRIAQQHRPDLVGDGAERSEVEVTLVRGPAGDDQLRTVLEGLRAHLIHVDQVRVLTHAVGRDVEPTAGQVELHPVAEVPTVRQRHGEDRVARFEHSEEDREVRARSGVWLHVRMFCAEQFLRAIDGELLEWVDRLDTPAVVAAARVALGVLVREHRTLCSEHGG